MSHNVYTFLYYIARFFVVIVVALLWFRVSADTLNSTNYQLEKGTFSAGGVVSDSSATYSMAGTYGEAIVGGDIVAVEFEEIAGFQAAVVGIPVVPEPEPEPEEEEEDAPIDGGSGASGDGAGAGEAPVVVISDPPPPDDIPVEPPPQEEPVEEPPVEEPVDEDTPPFEELPPPEEEDQPLFPYTPDITIPPMVQGAIDSVVQGVSNIAAGATRIYKKLEAQPVFKVAQQATRFVLETTEQILENPVANATAKTVTTTAVIAIAGPPVITVATAALADPALMLFKLWGALLSLLGIRKRSKPWGTVYDSVTKQPLDPAYVVLSDAAGAEISTDISDLDGRFGFLVPQGTYYLLAHKTHYVFPSKRLAGKTYDEVYSGLYFGEPLSQASSGGAIVKNIPMDPVGFDWNEFAKKDQKLMKFYSRHDLLIGRITNIFFILGSIIAVPSAIVLPGPYNLIVAGVYGLVLLLRMVGPRKRTYGTIATRDGTPLSFAIVRVCNASNIEILHTVCDQYGRYFALVPNGDYTITIEKKTGEDAYEKVYTSGAVSVDNGILTERVRL